MKRRKPMFSVMVSSMLAVRRILLVRHENSCTKTINGQRTERFVTETGSRESFRERFSQVTCLLYVPGVGQKTPQTTVYAGVEQRLLNPPESPIMPVITSKGGVNYGYPKPNGPQP